jgi:hypothetical protein
MMKVSVVTIAFCYWEVMQDEGRGVVQLKYLQSLLYAISETAFFCALLLVAKGWRITRTGLPPSEIRTISVALVLLLSTLLFFSFYSEGYYFLSLMIMYFFMLPKIFTSITRNTRALQTQLLVMRYATAEAATEPLIAKMRMFKTLRTAVILYLGSILMVSSMRIIMLWYLLWVNYCVSELIALVMVSVVAFLLRPRENGAFSTRAFLEGNPFPILNMQNLDHFDEFFGEHLLDPDMVLMNAGMRDGPQADDFDMTTTLVIEYPAPTVLSSSGKPVHYPRLALATLEKPPSDDNGTPNNTSNNDSNNNHTTTTNPTVTTTAIPSNGEGLYVFSPPSSPLISTPSAQPSPPSTSPPISTPSPSAAQLSRRSSDNTPTIADSVQMDID